MSPLMNLRAFRPLPSSSRPFSKTSRQVLTTRCQNSQDKDSASTVRHSRWDVAFKIGTVPVSPVQHSLLVLANSGLAFVATGAKTEHPWALGGACAAIATFPIIFSAIMKNLEATDELAREQEEEKEQVIKEKWQVIKLVKVDKDGKVVGILLSVRDRLRAMQQGTQAGDLLSPILQMLDPESALAALATTRYTLYLANSQAICQIHPEMVQALVELGTLITTNMDQEFQTEQLLGKGAADTKYDVFIVKEIGT